MSYKLINSCPVCSSAMKATRLSCNTCGTVIENDFSLSKFDRLSEDQLAFAEIFIKNSGSIKDVEKEMGISYPTVKGKLNDLIKAFGYNIEAEKPEKSPSVIDLLERGEITPEEALKKINENK
ncbi:MAG: DUF2089 domain-containing protein [Ignavibacteria bacterium]|nr:DUF2089 domain-containing protein [Ignavibacteria bacterium]